MVFILIYHDYCVTYFIFFISLTVTLTHLYFIANNYRASIPISILAIERANVEYYRIL